MRRRSHATGASRAEFRTGMVNHLTQLFLRNNFLKKTKAEIKKLREKIKNINL